MYLSVSVCACVWACLHVRVHACVCWHVLHGGEVCVRVWGVEGWRSVQVFMHMHACAWACVRACEHVLV